MGKQQFTEEQNDVLESISLKRIILPVLLGLGVVIYLLVRQFDPQVLFQIEWTNHILFWVLGAIGFLILRHLAYALRLWILTNHFFSFTKCIQLIFIWEFSSAVSPTSVGGSAVALFMLSQEKLKAAKTATIVLYTVVLDTFFFILGIPILVSILGFIVIAPNAHSFGDIKGWGVVFLTTYAIMFSYGVLFFYGLFRSPKRIKSLLLWICNWAWTRKWYNYAEKLGDDIILASREIWRQEWHYHLGAILTTITAWSSRFLLLNCLILAFMTNMEFNLWEQFNIYARIKSMYVITSMSPTPGTAGVAEAAFGKHLEDIVTVSSIAILIAVIWKLLTYYSYLIIGAIVIPAWMRGLLKKRKKKNKTKKIKKA